MNAIDAHALSFTYRSPWPWVKDQQALLSTSLQVEAGQVHALVGANGSGKSTMLKVLVGELRPEAGKVTVLGLDPGHRTLTTIVGYLPEVAYGETRLKVREALELQAALDGIPRRQVAERIGSCLREVGMEDSLRRRITALSKGQRRRVALAQCLLSEPQLLLLDEPFDGVDPVRCEELCELLRQRAANGMTVVFSSHSLTEVELAADHLSLFATGRVVLHGLSEDITTQDGGWSLRLKDSLSREEAEALAERLGDRSIGLSPLRRSLADLLREHSPSTTSRPEG